MEHFLSGNLAARQEILEAELLAKRHFANGHLNNPYKYCPILSDAYDRAAMALIKGYTL